MIWGYPHGLETSIYCFLAIHVHGNTSSCLALSWGFRTMSPTNRYFPLWASMKFWGKNSITFPMFQYQRHDIWGSQPTISGQSPMISWVQNKGPILQKLALQPRVTLRRRLCDVTSLKCWGFTILGFWIHHLLVDWTGLGRYGDESNKPVYTYIYIYTNTNIILWKDESEHPVTIPVILVFTTVQGPWSTIGWRGGVNQWDRFNVGWSWVV